MIINFLGLIPARKGSKRLKQKNLKKLNNKKLIQYTFESSMKSKRIEKILLTSNDPAVIKLAKKFKLDFIIKRPEKFSRDQSSMEDVVKHTIKHLESSAIKVKNIILLQPTTPLRTSSDIDNMVDHYIKKRLDYCVSVSKPITHSLQIFHTKNNQINLNQNKKFKNFNHLFLNGSIYIFKVKNFLKNKKIYKSKVNYFMQGLNNSIDINNELDFEIIKSLKSKIRKIKVV